MGLPWINRPVECRCCGMPITGQFGTLCEGCYADMSADWYPRLGIPIGVPCDANPIDRRPEGQRAKLRKHYN